MNKLLSLILVLLITAGSMGALAEITLTEYAVISEDLDADFISDTNLLSVGEINAKALAALDGTVLSDNAYRSFSEQFGWIVVTRVSDDRRVLNGLLAPDGAVVIPADYNDVDMLNENWAVGIKLEDADKSDYDYESWTSDNVYKITVADIFYLPTAQIVASLPRENYKRSQAYDQYINVTDRTTGQTTVYDAAFNPLKQVDNYFDNSMLPEYTTFNDNGLQGLKAPDGSVIIEPTYKSVFTDVWDGYFLVSDYDYYGLCDLSGRLVVPIEYDTIPLNGDKYVYNGYACVEQNDLVGYVNVQTGEVAMSHLSSNNGYNHGLSFSTQEGDNLTIFAADGVETHLSGVDNANAYADGLFYTIANSDYKWGLIDWHGEEILPQEYDTISVTADGLHVVTRYTGRDPLKVYTMSGDPIPDAAESPSAPEVAAEDQPSDDAPAPEAAAVEGAEISDQEEATPAADSAAAAELLNSAIALLKADPAANSAAAVSLIHSVATQISGNDTALAQLNSVITLLNDNPAANGAAAITLLESLIPLL